MKRYKIDFIVQTQLGEISILENKLRPIPGEIFIVENRIIETNFMPEDLMSKIIIIDQTGKAAKITKVTEIKKDII